MHGAVCATVSIDRKPRRTAAHGALFVALVAMGQPTQGWCRCGAIRHLRVLDLHARMCHPHHDAHAQIPNSARWWEWGRMPHAYRIMLCTMPCNMPHVYRIMLCNMPCNMHGNIYMPCPYRVCIYA